MKVLLLTLMISFAFTFTASASMNDFECDFYGLNGEQVTVEVERSYPGGQGTKTISVTSTDNGSQDQFRYYTSARLDRYRNTIEYFGGGLDLEINLWPDNRPQWGRTYRSEFRSYDINNGHLFYNIYCRYTGF